MFDFLVPVLVVTVIQPDQVLGLKERFPRLRRGAALIFVTSIEMRKGIIEAIKQLCRFASDGAVGRLQLNPGPCLSGTPAEAVSGGNRRGNLWLCDVWRACVSFK